MCDFEMNTPIEDCEEFVNTKTATVEDKLYDLYDKIDEMISRGYYSEEVFNDYLEPMRKGVGEILDFINEQKK